MTCRTTEAPQAGLWRFTACTRPAAGVKLTAHGVIDTEQPILVTIELRSAIGGPIVSLVDAVSTWTGRDDMGNRIGYATREKALKVSATGTASPRATELQDGSFAAGREDTIDDDGRVTSWVELPGKGLVRWAEISELRA